jgi:AcrR family transcriptional regulator
LTSQYDTVSIILVVSKTSPDYSRRTAARTRNRIALIDAAAHVLAERGYRGASVAAVAERAGLTKGAVYSIFGSKVALFGALLEPQNDGFALTNAIDIGAPLNEALGAVGRYWAAFSQQPEARTGLLLGYELGLDVLHSGETTDEARQVLGRVVDRFADELSSFAVASGETLPRASRDIAIAVLGSMQGLATMHVMGLVTVDESVFVTTAQGVLHDC